MGMIDQVIRETELASPLSGRLAAIQGVLDRAGDPMSQMSETEAMSAIAKLVERHSDRSEIYQKPWG